MAGYTTAVTDWTAADYFNVADWMRIYRNAELTVGLVEIELAATIGFNEADPPTTTTDLPRVTDFNILTGNIERLRAAVVSVITSLTTEIKDDWEAGIGKPALKYSDVNLWESVIDTIWQYYDGPDLEECPTLTGNLTISTGTYEVYVDCLNISTYKVTINGTGKLYIL